jgi:hypothetical protein
MRFDEINTLTLFEDRTIADTGTPTINGDLGGGSNISEPEILNPIVTPVITPVKSGSSVIVGQNGVVLENPSDVKSQDTKEPSATTDETKTYVGGGTTPDSNIVVDKPKRNYFMYGVLGVVGVYVIYKVFFNKKPVK